MIKYILPLFLLLAGCGDLPKLGSHAPNCIVASGGTASIRAKAGHAKKLEIFVDHEPNQEYPLTDAWKTYSIKVPEGEHVLCAVPYGYFEMDSFRQ